MTKRIAVAAVVLTVALGGMGAWIWYELMKRPVIEETAWLYIEGSTLSAPQLLDNEQMAWAGRLTHLDERLEAGTLTGAYRLREGMTAMQVARKLSRRQQDPVRMTLGGARLKEQVAGRMARVLLCDSASVVQAMLDQAFLALAETDAANVGSVLLPDTYEVYWDIKPEDLMRRMLKEYRKFWNQERQDKARAMGLTPREVSILASIAEEETANRQERGVVGRLYCNRLQQGMLLQADPTVKFALGDFGLKRILLRHLEVQSPYNTYQHPGLPPGPIRIVEKATIDTLLNARPHPYIYMCAKPDFSGRHNFATTLSEHNRNAAAYHEALTRNSH